MALGLEKEDSVYDFLYVDSRRIAIFVSQLSQNGSIVSLTRTATDTTTSGGGLNVGIVKVDSAGSGQTSQTRQFDTQWVAPLNFLDEAQKHGMIERDLTNARIGSLTLVSGQLSVFDLSILKAAWDLPGVRKILSSSAPEGQPPQLSSRADRKRHHREQFSDPSSLQNEVGLDMLKHLPHAIIAAVGVERESVWCTLREDSLVVSVSDLLLKHGVSVSGEWSMLGILDALPDESDYQLRSMQAGMAFGAIGQMLGAFAPATRGMLGRPAGAFGMTPILIFREINS